ncbi:hypothetical protein [Sediminibacterium ginsengisoli]|uniref:Uncharacterized protein n=1 Tax=Sediminibacterium ginsengisoli TaxID=413434 RepID=A0A1T4R3F3_9BACT|nr:hypothetical protein [Sediminibacterium ginsengisoli]SKA10158.1 hypothetical protein SAMN04488132_11084 [Sediminibacterium ginsengisoli]
MYPTWLKVIVCSCLLVCVIQLRAGDSLVMRKLLQRIEQLQVKDNSVFPAGSFPSYRTYALNKDRQKADVNPFFTGLIAFTLREIQADLSPGLQEAAARIIGNTLPAFGKFRNRTGRPTYNFWPTDTPAIFPNGGWLNLFNRSQALPDDLDDTGIILMATAADSAAAAKAHDIMQEFTNNGKRPVKNTFSKYRKIGAYSTWFGKKMPVDFDICVLSNVLYMVQHYRLRWTAADSASLELITNIIADKKHTEAPSYVSPHYGSIPIILYHISRLMLAAPLPALEKYRPQLIAEAKTYLAHTKNFADQVLLGTTLLRWGVQSDTSWTHITTSFHRLVEDESFSFFIANMASMLPDPLKKWLGSTGAGKFYYYCPAYNNLLLLEYLALQKRMALTLRKTQ